jgi:hypothetical protein
MTSSTLEHERDKTEGKATVLGPLGGAADRVESMSSLTSENARHAVRDSSQRVRDFIERATADRNRK